MARVKVEKGIAYDDVRKKYYVTFDYGIVDGKQFKQTKTYDKKRDAQRALKEFQASKTNGDLVIPSTITLSEWLNWWMDNIIIHNAAKTTVYGYRNIIRHIELASGGKVLQKLTATDIQGYLSDIQKKLSSNTALKHYTLMRTALDVAVNQDILKFNPAYKVIPPNKVKKVIHFYDKEELRQLLKIAEGTREEIIIKLGIFLGLRRGEIAGLKWHNVDFDNRLVHIRETRTTAGSVSIEKGVKTEESERVLYLSEPIYLALREEYKKQEIIKAEKGHKYKNQNYVVCWEDGRPIRPNYISELFTNFINRNGLKPLTLHGLRHSFASLANYAQNTLYDTSKMLGHSTPSTTSDIYTHQYRESHTEQLDKMAKLLE